MDNSQETKLRAMLQVIATTTGQPDFPKEIFALAKKGSECLESLNQVANDRDEVLQSLDKATIGTVDKILRTNESKLREEINQNVERATALKEVNIAKMKRSLVEREIQANEVLSETFSILERIDDFTESIPEGSIKQDVKSPQEAAHDSIPCLSATLVGAAELVASM